MFKKSSTFTKTLLSETLPVKIEEKFPELLTKSCYEIWNLYFTDELFSYIIDQTKLHAGRDKNDPSFDISLDDLRNYIGILIFSGYCKFRKRLLEQSAGLESSVYIRNYESR